MPEDNAYSWNSENAKLEIAELLYALKLNGRISINAEKGTNEIKSRKQFYELFGLSDEGHNQKIQQILERKNKQTYLSDLADSINKLKSKKKNSPK